MKIQAYKCDICNTIYEGDNIRGLFYNPDMFNKLNSFTICKPEKSNSHYCIHCFTKNVSEPCELLSIEKKEGFLPKRNTEKYDILLKDYKYSFYRRVFRVNNLGVI